MLENCFWRLFAKVAIVLLPFTFFFLRCLNYLVQFPAGKLQGRGENLSHICSQIYSCWNKLWEKARKENLQINRARLKRRNNISFNIIIHGNGSQFFRSINFVYYWDMKDFIKTFYENFPAMICWNWFIHYNSCRLAFDAELIRFLRWRWQRVWKKFKAKFVSVDKVWNLIL